MNRRQILAAVAGVGGPLAGCSSLGSTATRHTESPSHSPGGLVGYCPEDPESKDVEVPPWPTKPDSLTRETVARFVTQYEHAYVARLALPTDTGTIKAVHVSGGASTADISRTGGGWLAHFAVSEPELVYRSPTPTDSPHYDPALNPVSYFVTTDAVFRAMEATVDPREKGQQVQCHAK